MPQVTKKIYPTVTGYTSGGSDGYSLCNSWRVGTNKVAYAADDYKINVKYDLSEILGIISGKLVVAFKSISKNSPNSWPVLVNSKVTSSIGYNKLFRENKAEFKSEYTFSSSDIEDLKNNKELNIQIQGIAEYNLNYDVSRDMWLCDVWSNLQALENQYVECICVDPEISDFNLVGTSIDNEITCSWAQEDVERWTVQAIQNNVVIATKTGTTATSCTFGIGELKKGGKTTFKLIAKYGENTVEESTTVDLGYTQAKATLIDIPGTTINIDEKFTIAWVSENQTSFVLTVDGKTYKGTTEKSITLPGGTINKGIKSINLTINFKNAYYSNSSSISTTFTAYGKPNKPTITSKSIISSALPYITWISTEQVSYLVTIKKQIATVETSGEVLNQAKYYQVVKALENNTTYKVTVKIKNQYNLWSEEAVLEFRTQFIVPNTPTIAAIADATNGAIILNVSTDIADDSEYKNTEIWKREPLGEWKRMAYNLSNEDAWADFYVGNEVKYEYKARNIGQMGGISESDTIIANTVVKGYTLYNVENLENKLSFKYDVEITPKLITNIVTNLFAGADAPQISTDGVMYWNCSISFKTLERNDILKLIKLIKTSKVLLFKDCRGHKYFGNIIGSPSFPETDLRIINIQIEFTETSFLEQDVYCGDNMGIRLIKWDGTWRFDGTKSYHS